MCGLDRSIFPHPEKLQKKNSREALASFYTPKKKAAPHQFRYCIERFKGVGHTHTPMITDTIYP